MMETLQQNSAAGLCEEILNQARSESENIIARAGTEASTILARAEQESRKSLEEALTEARQNASRRTALLLATVPAEAQRQRVEAIERLLGVVYQRVREQLAERQDFDYHKTLLSLAVEAIPYLSGKEIVIKLSPADHATLAGYLSTEIARRFNGASLEVRILSDPTLCETGLLLEDSSGHQRWDYRLLARLERLWPALRHQIASRLGLLDETVTREDALWQPSVSQTNQRSLVLTGQS